jgi:RND family efflux transporter MFP subunit
MTKKGFKVTIGVIASLIAIAIIGILVYTLTHKEQEEEDTQSAIMTKEETIVEVDTMVLRKQTFQKQILCNGKLTAIRRAELVCPKAGEVLLSVNVKNGQHVSAGTLLAVAETRDRKRELEKARHDLERARVELQDKLIALGYDGNEKNVPADVLRRAEVTSGYYSAKYALLTAETSLSDCKLLAPFSGRIADLQARPHQRGDKLCTLIDDSFFDVEFQILEAELASVCLGTQVRVSPFVDEQIALIGNVTEINPTIDNKGLVTIKARIKNTSDKLLDGMNVKVIIENAVPDMLIVPKEAVVERDGYHVVFVYDKQTHRAIWTYVDIMYSNLTSFAITGCERKNTSISVGDIVITSGNLNLADDTDVKIVKSKE